MPEDRTVDVAASGKRRSTLADIIESARPEILELYEERLRNSRSPLIDDDATWAQVRGQADGILADILVVLSGGSLSGQGLRASRAVGAARAARNIHPSESLRAAVALFDAVLAVISPRLPPQESADALTRVARAANRSITFRISAAAAAYTSFLLENIHQAHIDERRRIARELHDHVSLGASIAHRQLELWDLNRKTDEPEAVAAIETAKRVVRETLVSIRDLTVGLRLVEPMESLERALTTFAESMVAEGACAAVSVNGDETWVPQEMLDEAFLMIREALRNALVHGKARSVRAVVDIAPHELRATVDDDGVGFDTTRTDRHGSGLASMQERAAILDAKVRVSSQPEYGTSVEILIPLPGRARETVR